VAELIDAVARDTGTAPGELRTDGGLTGSRILMQTQADLAQIPVRVAASPDATALGVAALTRLGAGVGSPAGSSTAHPGRAAREAPAGGGPGSVPAASSGARPEDAPGEPFGGPTSEGTPDAPDGAVPVEAGAPPSAVYEPRIGPDEAAERRAAFRAVLDGLLGEDR